MRKGKIKPSIAERLLPTDEFQSSLEELLSLICDSKSASDLAERWAGIYHELKEEQHKSLLMKLLLYPDTKYKSADGEVDGVSIITPDHMKVLQNILSAAEKIKEAGLLNEAMDLSLSLLKLSFNRKRERLTAQVLTQTSSATNKRKIKNFEKNYPVVLKLKTYFVEVEEEWHKSSQGPVRSSAPNKTNALIKVFKNDGTEITNILESYGYREDLVKVFSKLFDYWRNHIFWFLSDDLPASVFRKEKRAERSEEAKEHFRKPALDMWKKRRRANRKLKRK